MKGELFINGKDTFETWGVNMGDGFLESLYSPAPMKEVIENKSRLEHGKRVIFTNPQKDERELTLIFTLMGDSKKDYIDKYKAFITEISAGDVAIKVPALGEEVYHVYYLRSNSFAWSIDRTFSKISIKFCEPNPGNRA